MLTSSLRGIMSQATLESAKASLTTFPNPFWFVEVDESMTSGGSGVILQILEQMGDIFTGRFLFRWLFQGLNLAVTAALPICCFIIATNVVKAACGDKRADDKILGNAIAYTKWLLIFKVLIHYTSNRFV